MLRFCFCAFLLRCSSRGHRVVRDVFGVSFDTRAFVRGHERAVLGVACVLASSLFFSKAFALSIFLFDRAVVVPMQAGVRDRLQRTRLRLVKYHGSLLLLHFTEC
jgi:hypothetical protein